MNFDETNLLNIDFLANNFQRLYYFGLGFIQLKLDEEHRIHFYTNEFEKTTNEEIHNHRYDFRSKIIKGTLTQEIFEVLTYYKGDWKIIEESCNPLRKIGSRDIPCIVRPSTTQELIAGSAYEISHNTFHRVSSENAITFLKRSEYKKEVAHVVMPRFDYESKCPFSVGVDNNKLLEVIREMVR